MRFFLIFQAFFLFAAPVLRAQANFESFFENKTLRMDYIRAGNSDTSFIFFKELRQEPFWGGSHTNLIDTFSYGDYRLLVFDAQTDSLIYSRGYSSLFFEWQTTSEAKKMQRSFAESVLMPFPKNDIRIELQKRNPELIFQTIYTQNVSPDSYFIKKEALAGFPVKKIVDSGEPHQKLDIVFLPEGYTAAEMEKFSKDAERFAGYLFDVEPFGENKDKINLWTVEAPSAESGTDIPGANLWRQTTLNSNFYTFDMERYLTTLDFFSVRNVAAHVPYDQIYIIVNTKKYGGGGVFNFYSICTADHRLSEKVFTHELGHGFGGLADEYASNVSYQSFYNSGLEPTEPNITALINFQSKWKNMVAHDTPVPTPAKQKYADKVGVFEGAAYQTKGMYRPALDCKMRSNQTNRFCPVCQRALMKMILFYSQK